MGKDTCCNAWPPESHPRLHERSDPHKLFSDLNTSPGMCFSMQARVHTHTMQFRSCFFLISPHEQTFCIPMCFCLFFLIMVILFFALIKQIYWGEKLTTMNTEQNVNIIHERWRKDWVFSSVVFLFHLVETGSHTSKAGLQSLTFLLLLHKCWDYRRVPPGLDPIFS